MKEEKFLVGNRVAEETSGSLVSLESNESDERKIQIKIVGTPACRAEKNEFIETASLHRVANHTAHSFDLFIGAVSQAKLARCMGIKMANEDKKDFNAMLHESKDMPKFQIIKDQKSIEKYGGNRMYFAPPIDYDRVMKQVPYGKIITVGKIREHFAKLNGADFTEPITAGVFVSIAAWASYQRFEDETPYWRTLKANGELNAKYPGGMEAQKEKLEAEGHTIIQKGRKNIKYFVEHYEGYLFELG